MAQQNTNGKRKSTIKKVWHYLKNYRFLLILSILMAALTVAGTLYVPILVGDAIDFIIKKGQVNFAAIAKILEKGATVILFTGITQWIMNICNNHITFHVTRDIRNEAMKKIEKLPLKYIDGHSYGDVVSRVIADVDQFADGLLMGFTQFFTGVDDSRYAWIYFFHPCRNCSFGCLSDTDFFISCPFYRNSHLLYV